MFKIDNVSFGFPSRPILKQFSLQVAAGEVVHLVGPNGAGKTTLMSLLAGIFSPQQGAITYTPQKASAPAADRRHFVEYLPAEANGLLLKLDAMSNLRFWLGLRGSACSDQDIVAVLKEWGLDHVLVRQGLAVEKFSTGMKRRLALARLALVKAECWLLDEPLYGLDEQAIGTFQNQLKQHLERQGLAIIVSHDYAPLQKFQPRQVRIHHDRG